MTIITAGILLFNFKRVFSAGNANPPVP